MFRRTKVSDGAIYGGLISSVFAIGGGFYERSGQRLLIVLSSLALTFLWILAGAASVPV